jgi:ketosteroid isomerase-like protein
MAEANIESMKRGFAAFSRGDWDGCLAEIHPDIEWHLTFQLPDLPPDKKIFRGHDEVRMLFEELSGVWNELTLELLEVLQEDDDGQILKVRFAGRGGGSGVEVDRILFYVHDVKDGLLLRQRPFDTAEEAFAAAGVEP